MWQTVQESPTATVRYIYTLKLHSPLQLWGLNFTSFVTCTFQYQNSQESTNGLSTYINYFKYRSHLLLTRTETETTRVIISKMSSPLHCIVYKRIRCTTWQCWLFWCKISSQKEARTKCQNVRNVGIWYIVTSACETMKLDAIKMLLYRVPAIYVLHSFSSRTVQNVRMVSEAGYNCWFPIILLLKRKSTYV